MPRSNPLSFRAYARHRGVTLRAVQVAHRSGRLQRSIVMVDGTPKIRSAAAADREWDANTDISKLPDALKVARHGRRAGTRRDRGPRSAPQSDDTQQPDLSDATIRDKHFRAKLAELKYRERAGQLVDAAEVKAEIIDMITVCRTKLLGLPSKVKQRLPHLTLEDLATLDAIVREALEDLAAPQRTPEKYEGPPKDAA